MNIQIYFEIISGQKGGLALNINGSPIGLSTAIYEEKRLLSCEISQYNDSEINVGLTSLTGAVILKVYFVNKNTNKVFVERLSLEDGRHELKIKIGLNLISDDISDDSSYTLPPKTNPTDRPSYKRPKKKTYSSTISFNKESITEPAKLPDYSYYDKQTPRKDLLTAKADESQNTIVEVFYATDRQRKKKKKGRITYTNTRGDLELGKCVVTVPANKKKGDTPLPPWYLFGLSTNEDEYILIKEVNQLVPTEFFAEIRSKVQSSPEKDAFVFIHGFNVSFTESVIRAAQIAADIGFRGAPIIYSWPSRGRMLRYKADEATSTGYSTDNIIQLLKDVRTTTGAERVHLIAHSMGNRHLTEALKSMVDQGFNEKFIFNQIILAAPDIDAEVFVKHIAPRIVKFSERVTLYASHADKALWFSKMMHGGIQRTGTVGGTLAWVEGIDTIDASIEKTEFLGHGYFAESKLLVDDIFNMTRYNKSPEDRNLRKKISGNRFYYEFW